MEEKKSKRHNSIWSFFGFWRNIKSFFWRSAGFTLVELLVVIGVLGILLVAALLIVDPAAQIEKANDARRKSDISQIQKALETYYNDNGKYPPINAAGDYRIQALNGNPVPWGSAWQPYMSLLPIDPRPQRNYVYYAPSDRQSYYLYASLERSNDQQFCNKGNPCSSLTTNNIPTNSCGGTCNFGATSSNVSP